MKTIIERRRYERIPHSGTAPFTRSVKYKRAREKPNYQFNRSMRPLKNLLAISLALASALAAAAAGGMPIKVSFGLDGTNHVHLAWAATPGATYVLNSTTNLLGSWQPTTLTATNNSIALSLPGDSSARFFHVVKLDTQGPEIYRTSPMDKAICVDPQSVLRAWLRDPAGVNTNSINLAVGANQSVGLNDPRLRYSADGVLTYTPGTNEVLGALGQKLAVSLWVADTLGNQTTNFTWRFQLALPTVLSSNIVLLGSSSNGPAGLKLIATDGTNFTYSYTGSFCGLTNGLQLVNPDPSAGYTCTVAGFTDNPANHTVVVATRPTPLAELLDQGSLASGSFADVTAVRSKSAAAGLQLNYSVPLDRILYQDANLLVEILQGSALNLGTELKLAANFEHFSLTAFEGSLEGTADLALNLHALAYGAVDFAGSTALIMPIRRTYFRLIGCVPVWVDLVFEVNAGYTASLAAQAGFTTGIGASKQIIFGKHWDRSTGWTPILENPDFGFAFVPPAWQIEGSADVRVYVQPKVTLLVYSTVGVTGDLKPYAELAYTVQLTPPQCDLGLYAGLDCDLALNLTVWDSKWDQVPSTTFSLIPRTLLWHTDCVDGAPRIIQEPADQNVTVGSEARFSVGVQGAQPLSYQWLRDGLPLTDDGRVSGSTNATLRLPDAQAGDVGGYHVHVSNSYGSTNSSVALLTVTTNLFLLSIRTSGTGSGTVTADPSGPLYATGTVVTVTATPNTGSVFAGWSGAATGTNAAILIMDADKSLTATFNLPNTPVVVEGYYTGSYSGTTRSGRILSGPIAFRAYDFTAVWVTAPAEGDGYWGGGGVGDDVWFFCSTHSPTDFYEFNGTFSLSPAGQVIASGQFTETIWTGSGTWSASQQ